MKLKIEMNNGKLYNINYPETMDFFLQEIEFAEGNKFLLTESGTYVKMSEIIEFTQEK